VAKSKDIGGAFFTRENFMFFGMLTLLLSSILTFFGTSAPLFSGIFLDQASDVSIEYYTLLNTPVALLLGFFIAISPALSWGKNKSNLIKKLLGPLISSLILTVIAYFVGIKNVVHLTIFFLFLFAVFINLELVISMIRKKNWGFGGYLSHVGIGLMMMGVITSNAYETSIKTTLPLQAQKRVLDYDMKYLGFRTGADGKDEAVIEISGTPVKGLVANPKFYWSEFNQAYMRNPSVHNLWIKDIYISPIQVIPAEENNQGNELKIKKGGEVYFEDYLFRFLGYEMDGHDTSAGKITISAVINIMHGNDNHQIRPSIIIENGEQKIIAEPFPHSSRSVSIADINVEDDTLTLNITNDSVIQAAAGMELLAIEVTEKPLINILWLGTVLMIVGLAISLIYRTRISRL
jgi:cytochrome c-type biogenesis protein CcmF